jgi:hypothetical protein
LIIIVFQFFLCYDGLVVDSVLLNMEKWSVIKTTINYLRR